MILNHKLVGCDADMEGVVLAPPLSLLLPLFLVAEISKDLEAWAPSFELHFPIDNDGGRNYDQVWTPDSLVTGQRCQHGDCLDGLTESHLISKDSIQSLVMESHQPV